MNKDANFINKITLKQLKKSLFLDTNYQELIRQIKRGFPKTRNNVNRVLQPFLEVQHDLTTCDNLISMDDRVAIPTSLQKQIFYMLHSAHHELQIWQHVQMYQFIGNG